MTVDWQTWAVRATALALAASLVPPAAGLARLLALPPPAQGAAASPAAPALPDPSPSSLGAILDAAPFGQAPDDPVADAPVADGSAADGLALLGVAVAASPAASRAMIAGGIRGASALYGPGDTVAEGITLTAVQPDGVTLDAGGQARQLGFPTAGAAGTAARTEPATGLIDFSGATAPATGANP